MKELREAMNQFLQEFAERAQQNPNAPQMQQNGQELRQSDIDRMMDEIENLAKSGDRDRAQQLLSELQDMMNNLQAGRRQPGGEQDSEMRQQMDKLGEIMRRQQEMMNDTFRMDQMQRGNASAARIATSSSAKTVAARMRTNPARATTAIRSPARSR
ncbi:hypothetical protein AJ88_44345 [Mesorhizobium amorphae CCBAU 01583]|nr:hypothetical protein AJ88_44345 [Mesorhizobium amorphae CCBAU 01583]